MPPIRKVCVKLLDAETKSRFRGKSKSVQNMEVNFVKLQDLRSLKRIVRSELRFDPSDPYQYLTSLLWQRVDGTEVKITDEVFAEMKHRVMLEDRDKRVEVQYVRYSIKAYICKKDRLKSRKSLDGASEGVAERAAAAEEGNESADIAADTNKDKKESDVVATFRRRSTSLKEEGSADTESVRLFQEKLRILEQLESELQQEKVQKATKRKSLSTEEAVINVKISCESLNNNEAVMEEKQEDKDDAGPVYEVSNPITGAAVVGDQGYTNESTEDDKNSTNRVIHDHAEVKQESRIPKEESISPGVNATWRDKFTPPYRSLVGDDDSVRTSHQSFEGEMEDEDQNMISPGILATWIDVCTPNSASPQRQQPKSSRSRSTPRRVVRLSLDRDDESVESMDICKDVEMEAQQEKEEKKKSDVKDDHDSSHKVEGPSSHSSTAKVDKGTPTKSSRKDDKVTVTPTRYWEKKKSAIFANRKNFPAVANHSTRSHNDNMSTMKEEPTMYPNGGTSGEVNSRTFSRRSTVRNSPAPARGKSQSKVKAEPPLPSAAAKSTNDVNNKHSNDNHNTNDDGGYNSNTSNNEERENARESPACKSRNIRSMSPVRSPKMVSSAESVFSFDDLSSAESVSGGDGMGAMANVNGKDIDMSTLLIQMDFMKRQLGVTKDEELEWMMTSKKEGAYAFASSKLERTLDKFSRIIYEKQVVQTKIDILMQSAGSSKSKNTVSVSIQLVLKRIVSLGLEKDENSAKVQLAKLYRGDFKDLVNDKDIPLKCSDTIWKLVCALYKETHFPTSVQKVNSIQKLIKEELKILQKMMERLNSEEGIAMEESEKWSFRQKSAIDYAKQITLQNEEWLAKEKENNRAALEQMRTFLNPLLLQASTTVASYSNAIKAKGCLFSYELVHELRSNLLLQWCITHTDDIAKMGFLYGPTKLYYTDYRHLDIIETRAICAVLPQVFENDASGEKSEWKNSFIQRAKVMASSEKRELIKGAYDPSLGRRAMIEAEALKSKLMRRDVYFYKTYTACQGKVKEYKRKATLLQTKERKLLDVIKESHEATIEFKTILEEIRNPHFVELKDKLKEAKSLAAEQMEVTESKKRILTNEIKNLKDTIANYSQTQQDYESFVTELTKLLNERDISWSENSDLKYPIAGCFDAHITVERSVRAAVKGTDANSEEEARQKEIHIIESKSRSKSVTFGQQPMEASTAERSSPAVVHKTPNKITSSLDPALLQSIDRCLSSAKRPMHGNAYNHHMKTPVRNLNSRLSGAFNSPNSASSSKQPKETSVDVSQLKSKSRLLNKLLSAEKGRAEECDKENGVNKKPQVPALSFLDAIKARGVRESPVVQKAKPPLSFLDQIKARGAKQSEAAQDTSPEMKKAPIMSFLDQIKARGKVE